MRGLVLVVVSLLIVSTAVAQVPNRAEKCDAPCRLSAIPAVRAVQASAVFASAARAVAEQSHRDSAPIAQAIEWLCGQLRLSRPAHLRALQLVFGPAYLDVERIDIVFAVDRSRVVLLGPLSGGVPTGGLDSTAWNAFAAGGDALRITNRSQARALACALYRIESKDFVSANCIAREAAKASYSPTDSTWVARVQSTSADTGLVFRFSQTGVLR